MTHRVVFVQKAPTPYNDFLFRALSEDHRLTLEVAYLWTGTADRPWKSVLGQGYPARPMRVRWGIDWGLTRQAFADRSSLYIVGDWAHLATVAIVLARLVAGIPVALRVDTPQEQLPRRQPKRWLRARFLRWLLPRVNLIFATSEPAFRVLQTMGARNEQLVDFPFYTPLESLIDTSSRSWAARRTALRSTVGCGDKGVVFAMVGTIFPKKGMDIGLRAFARLKEGWSGPVGLLIAGDGPQRREIEELAKSLGVADAVNILGWQEPEGVEATILASDALVHAARFDPFPVAVLDAMRLGRAVLGSDVCGSVQARVRTGKNGIVFPSESVEALATIMRNVCETPACLTLWGGAARRTAEEWPVSHGIETVYQHAAQSIAGELQQECSEKQGVVR